MLNWYLQTGKDSDIVLSSKISLARNLSQFNFYIKEEQELLKLEKLIEENLTQIGYGLKYIKLKEINEQEIRILKEKGLIPEEAHKKISILVNDDENICILINYENHLNLQVFTSGLEIKEITNLCIEIDEKFQEIFDISKSKKYGYLTTSPTNVGTGMKITVMLHLPALIKTNNIQKVKRYVRQLGMEISKKQDDIYQISNERTLGITEENIVKNLYLISEKIIEQERTARKICAENKIELEDSIFRSYGVLTNCKKISQKEAEELISNIKLGTDLGILTDLTDYKIRKLYLYIKSANLNKYFNEELNGQDENIKRAEMIKLITKE